MKTWVDDGSQSNYHCRSRGVGPRVLNDSKYALQEIREEIITGDSEGDILSTVSNRRPEKLCSTRKGRGKNYSFAYFSKKKKKKIRIFVFKKRGDLRSTNQEGKYFPSNIPDNSWKRRRKPRSSFQFFFFSILEIRKYFFQRILCRWIDKMYESRRKQCGNFAIGREGKECWKEGGEFFLLKRVASGNIQVALYQGSMDLRRDAFGNNLLRFARKSVRQESIRCGS